MHPDDLSAISDPEPGGEPITLGTADGQALAATLHLPPGEPRAVVIVNCAMAVPQRFYAAFAHHLASRGLAALTYDYRGIGGSRRGSLRGCRATAREWAQLDFAAAASWAQERFRGRPCFAIGHSFGGQAISFTPGAEQLAGAVLVAAQSGYWGHWPPSARWRMGFYWYALFPLVCALWGYMPGKLGLGEDVPKGVILEWASWCRHPNYAFGRLEGAREQAASFRSPVLALSFSDDPYAPSPSVAALLGQLSATEPVHRHLAPAEVGLERIGHFGFFRKSHRKLWSIVELWLEARLRG